MKYGKACQLVLDECRQALGKVDEGQVKEFISLVYSSEKVFFIGVGRVLLSLEAFAKRLAHLGIDAVVVGEITEPAFTDKDLLVVGSGSGESLFPVAIAKKAKSIGGKVVHIGSNENSSMKEVTDLMVRIPVRTKLYKEDEISSEQPMSSLFEQALLLFGDSVSKMIVEEKQIELKQLWKFHANLE